MVEILVLDEGFRRIGAIAAFQSLIWTERYYDMGRFELHCDGRFCALLLRGAYIFRKDKRPAGIIETKQIKADGGVMVAGRFLEAVLEQRVIDRGGCYSGAAAEVAARIVADYCLGGERRIPLLRMGDLSYSGAAVSAMPMGKTVGAALRDILTEQEAAFRIVPDIGAAEMVLEIYRGKDRTNRQTEHSWCIFSPSYYNVLARVFETSCDRKNFAYVAAGDEANPLVVTVDKTEGAARRELYVKSSARQEEGMSAAAFRQALYDEGAARLEEYNISDRVECRVDVANAAFFELGDRCAFQDADIGVYAEGRVTEITESIEKGAPETSIVLGKEQLGLVRWVQRG